ncbi:hypothetical protein [Falsiroseomonas sp. HW251]|uniref:hypothetical protein n=1 Tax=Falsiroseomonas sp. HW251 TaxID=3390998 RepID=UPI003D31AB6C
MARIVTGTFNTREEAARASDALRGLSFVRRVALHEEPAQGVPPATDDAPGGEPGLPGLLDALFLPRADLAAHREAMRRGHVVVSAEVEDGREEDAVRALDDAGAIDLDEHEQAWRSEAPGPAASEGATQGGGAMPGTGGMDAESARRVAQGGRAETPIGPRDPVKEARRDPPIGRARSYAIDAPFAEEADPTLTGNEGGGMP